MPCTGDRELYFNVIRNPVCALAVEEGKSLRTFRAASACVSTADVLPNNRSRDLTPSDTCRRTHSSGDPASEKCNLSVSEPQRKNKHNVWEGDRVNTNTADAGQTCIWGKKNHKWICCLTGVEYSRTDLIEETQGTLSVLA